MEWYEDVEKAEIIDLQENMRPYGLCSKRKQEKFKQMLAAPHNDIQSYEGCWLYIDEPTSLDKSMVYRLSPQWTFETLKSRRMYKDDWMEYAVVENTHYIEPVSAYVFYLTEDEEQSRSCPLYTAISMIGFGGVEYEEWPDKWLELNVQKFLNGDGEWEQLLLSDVQYNLEKGSIIPATPIKVRFYHK